MKETRNLQQIGTRGKEESRETKGNRGRKSNNERLTHDCIKAMALEPIVD